MLTIKNLYVSAEKKEILKGINLKINKGEIHVIMGPNASGKSTLAKIIAGKDGYKITRGEIYFFDKKIKYLSPEKRAHLGIFMSFQNPVEIPGISIINFLKTSINSIRESKNLQKISPKEMLENIKKISSILKIDKKFFYRPLNYKFSGGEKKINEMFQMMMLNPSFSILDEIDSGLDIDAIKRVSIGINSFKNSTNSMLIITHYKRLLDYISSNVIIHIFQNGKIVKSGCKDIIDDLEKKGYDFYIKK